MNFVKTNKVFSQIKATIPIHYIFALDNSGSMKGAKWNSLMEAYSAAITTLI